LHDLAGLRTYPVWFLGGFSPEIAQKIVSEIGVEHMAKGVLEESSDQLN
jgi:hypothetical protein